MLQRYADYAPTAFDPRGLNASQMGDDDGGREDWLVCPVIQTRDSGSLEQSNFRTVLKDLGGESEDVEVHRFGHWGPGWFEIILVRPDTAVAGKALEWAESLSDYPVADEFDLSELESEDETESWDSWGRSDFRRALERRWMDADFSEVTDEDLDALWHDADGECEHGGDGPHFMFDRAVERLTPERARATPGVVRAGRGEEA